MEKVAVEKKKLKAIEYAWGCWPLIMVTVGGALGGLCGGGAAAINMKLFSSSRTQKSKYVLSFLVSIGSVLVYLLAAVVLVLIFPSFGKK